MDEMLNIATDLLCRHFASRPIKGNYTTRVKCFTALCLVLLRYFLSRTSIKKPINLSYCSIHVSVTVPFLFL